MNPNTPMTITIDIPAVQALANAINNLAASGNAASLIARLSAARSTPTPEALAALTADALGANDPEPPLGSKENPVVAVHPEDATPKRTRRTKAEMEAERKAIEEQKGRRVDLTTTSTEGETIQQNVVTDQPEPIEAVSALVDEANPPPFQWTLEQLVDTFIAPIQPLDKTEEAKEKANALRCELVAIRQEVDPKAKKMIEVDPQHYPELAKRFTAWFNDKGLKLQLPEGAE